MSAQEELDKFYVAPAVKKQALQTAIYSIIDSSPFVGNVLQCLDINYSMELPTAGVSYDNRGRKFVMLINPHTFCNVWDKDQRKAVLMHELSHITHKHLLRMPFMQLPPERRAFMNIAADMSINTNIPNLPKGCDQCNDQGPCPNELCPGKCIDVVDYYDVDDNEVQTPWPANRPFEYYYHKLIEKYKDQEPGKCGQCGKPNDGQGEGDNKGGCGSEGDGEEGGSGGCGGSGGGGEGEEQCSCPGQRGMPQEFDSHNWETGAEESDLLDAAEDLMKRTMQKTSTSFSTLPKHIQELLQDIETQRAELNYKALILSAIRRHATGVDRKHTWTRKSKRFGVLAPGTKVGNLPKLDVYIDTSGSISIEEANEFLGITDEFLKVGTRKCSLNLFHTEVYGQRQYKIRQHIERDEFQSGGTDLDPVVKAAIKRKSDLVIVLTDGYYSDVDFENKYLKAGQSAPQFLWVISKDGTEDHPLRRLGATVKIVDSSSKM